MVKTFVLLFTHENSGSLYLFCSRNTTYWNSKDALQHFVIWFFCLSSLLSTVDSLVEMFECYYHCQQWRDINIHSRKCSFLHLQRWLVLAKLKYILVYFIAKQVLVLISWNVSSHQHRTNTALWPQVPSSSETDVPFATSYSTVSLNSFPSRVRSCSRHLYFFGSCVF